MTKQVQHKIIFLGLAEHIEKNKQPFPVGNIDIYKFSQNKSHIIFPISITQYSWIFAVSNDFLNEFNDKKPSVVVEHEDGTLIKKIIFLPSEFPIPKKESNSDIVYDIPIYKNAEWLILDFNIDVVISTPGKYSVYFFNNDEKDLIGFVYFHYYPVKPFTASQIKAIESNPNAPKIVRMDLGCKYCDSKYRVYSGLDKSTQLEQEGYIWQQNIQNDFVCSCKKTKINLKFIKESLHGTLGKTIDINSNSIGYVRKYAHDQIIEIVTKFKDFLDKQKNEKTFQKFIEEHPVMLARFHAIKLYVQPDILGKKVADFAILNTQRQLVLIELERPSLKLFKKNGHQHADLTHAYGQIQDWIYEYQKHPNALLECFELTQNEITTVSGVVIGGRKTDTNFEHLQKHLSNPPYRNIDLLTLDDLAESVIQISRELK